MALAAVLLRLFFVWQLSMVTDDSLFYGELAGAMLHGHGLAVEKATGWQPTLSRLPGYPAFLALSFLLGGEGHYRTAMLLQVGFDLLTCLLVADIARRVAGERAARMALLLAAFCPFLMSYAAAALTECLEVFCLTAALDCVLIALELGAKPEPARRWWVLAGVCCAGAILLRPDGGLILGALALPLAALGWRQKERRRELLSGTLLLFIVSLAPLAPWTLRNWRAFHVFQPLVNTHASDPGESVPLGWERWLRSWVLDYASMEDVAFRVGTEHIDPSSVPSWAYSSEEQGARGRRLLEQHNERYRFSRQMDRQFGELAAENIRSHPLRYHVLLPAARVADMWLRPRTEMLPLNIHFWRIRQDPYDSACSLALAALNLGYLAAAVAGAWLLRNKRTFLGLLVTYPVVRSLFLGTIPTAEDRYTMECLPFVLVLAAVSLSWWQERQDSGGPLRRESAWAAIAGTGTGPETLQRKFPGSQD